MTLESRPEARHRAEGLIRPITVIVPVYNAPDDLRRLIASLEAVVPRPLERLSFLFTDDASTDPGIAAVMALPFFARPDVRSTRQAQNLGFLKNVNAAFLRAAELADGTDIVILNSDTRVFLGLFHTLQEEAYARPGIASVTPLTNNGTIASLFNWGVGAEVPACLGADALAAAVSELNLALPENEAPTGVGFCMYLRREALERVGMFDEVFSPGYGEEDDWCRRAVHLGFSIVQTTRAFVYHSGAKSFGSERSRRLVAEHGRLLLSRHPEYDEAVGIYFRRDALKFHRIAIVLHALARHGRPKAVHLLTLHFDPDARVGGTEGHVRSLRAELLADGRAVLTLAPVTPRKFVLRGWFGAGTVIEETVHVHSVPHLIALLEGYVDHLHVHHTLVWPPAAQTALAHSRIPRKAVTAHDFWFLCPSVNLLGRDARTFCGVEPDPVKCNACKRHRWSEPGDTIEAYRQDTLAFLEAFDTLLFPSDSMRPYFERAFGPKWAALAPRAATLNHDLAYVFRTRDAGESAGAAAAGPDSTSGKAGRIAFIGWIHPHKGADLIVKAIPILLAQGFHIDIFGRIEPVAPGKHERVQVTPYENTAELYSLLTRSQPDYLCYPSICAESFNLAFYEGLVLCPGAVPIVGPYGNPAAVARQEGLGPVMGAASVQALIEAVQLAGQNRAAYLEKVAGFVARLETAARTARNSYYTNYLSAIFQNPPVAGQHPAPAAVDGVTLASWAKLDWQHRSRESRALQAVTWLRHQLGKHATLQRVAVTLARPIWRRMVRIRAALARGRSAAL